MLLASVCLFALFFNLLQMRSSHDDRTFQKHEAIRLQIDDSRRNNVERVIFYNVFVPMGNDDGKRAYALSLVEEQLGYFHSASEFVQNSLIYYNLIGDTSATGEFERICQQATVEREKDNCKLMQAVEEGDEGLTLEAVYNYCWDHPRAQVTYIHNKGSFHPSPENDAMRQMLTKGVFADECQAMPIDECTVCASRFAPLGFTHFSGNMWTADCSYIKKLIRPSEFASKMDELVDHSLAIGDESVFPMPNKKYYLDRPYDYGTKRYAFEYWVGSQPQLKPCDVYAEAEYTYGSLFRNRTSISVMDRNWKPVLQKVPWLPIDWSWHWTFNEWHCGSGRLSQYKFLYGAYPDQDSYVWKLYEKPLKPHWWKHLILHMNMGCPIPIHVSDYT